MIKADGFEGVLYPAGNRYDKVMIVVSGSNGDFRRNAGRSVNSLFGRLSTALKTYGESEVGS